MKNLGQVFAFCEFATRDALRLLGSSTIITSIIFSVVVSFRFLILIITFGLEGVLMAPDGKIIRKDSISSRNQRSQAERIISIEDVMYTIIRRQGLLCDVLKSRNDVQRKPSLLLGGFPLVPESP